MESLSAHHGSRVEVLLSAGYVVGTVRVVRLVAHGVRRLHSPSLSLSGGFLGGHEVLRVHHQVFEEPEKVAEVCEMERPPSHYSICNALGNLDRRRGRRALAW